MAIMAIMASVLVPNVLKSVERAAVTAEAQTLHNLGIQIRTYLKATGAPPVTAVSPAVPNWSGQLALYTDLSAADLVTNPRRMQRVYVLEPFVFPATTLIVR